jgi:hypothetical protein
MTFNSNRRDSRDRRGGGDEQDESSSRPRRSSRSRSRDATDRSNTNNNNNNDYDSPSVAAAAGDGPQGGNGRGRDAVLAGQGQGHSHHLHGGRHASRSTSRGRRGRASAAAGAGTAVGCSAAAAAGASGNANENVGAALLAMEHIASTASRMYRSSQQETSSPQENNSSSAQAQQQQQAAVAGQMAAAAGFVAAAASSANPAAAAGVAAAALAPDQLTNFLSLLRALSAGSSAVEVERAQHILEACAGNLDLAAALYWDDVSHAAAPLAQPEAAPPAAAAAAPLAAPAARRGGRRGGAGGDDSHKDVDDMSAVAAAAKGAAAAAISNQEADTTNHRKRGAPAAAAGGGDSNVSNAIHNNAQRASRRRSSRNHPPPAAGGGGAAAAGAASRRGGHAHARNHRNPNNNDQDDNVHDAGAQQQDAALEAAEQVIQEVAEAAAAANQNNQNPGGAVFHEDSANVSDDEQAAAALLVESMAVERPPEHARNMAAVDAAVARHYGANANAAGRASRRSSRSSLGPQEKSSSVSSRTNANHRNNLRNANNKRPHSHNNNGLHHHRRLNELARDIYREHKALGGDTAGGAGVGGDDGGDDSSSGGSAFSKSLNADDPEAMQHRKHKRRQRARRARDMGTAAADGNGNVSDVYDDDDDDSEAEDQDTSFLLWGIVDHEIDLTKDDKAAAEEEEGDDVAAAKKKVPSHWKTAGFAISDCKTGPVAPMTTQDDAAGSGDNRRQHRRPRPAVTHLCGGLTGLLSIVTALLQSGVSVQGKKVGCHKLRPLGKRFADISNKTKAGQDYDNRLVDIITSLLWIAASSYHTSRRERCSRRQYRPLDKIGGGKDMNISNKDKEEGETGSKSPVPAEQPNKGPQIEKDLMFNRQLCRICTWQHDPIDAAASSNSAASRANEKICEAVSTSWTNMSDLRAYVVSTLPSFIGPGGCALLLETIVRLHGVKRIRHMVQRAGGTLPLIRCWQEAGDRGQSQDQKISSGTPGGGDDGGKQQTTCHNHDGCMARKRRALVQAKKSSISSGTGSSSSSAAQQEIVVGTTHCMSVELLSLLLTGSVHTNYHNWSTGGLEIGLLSLDDVSQAAAGGGKTLRLLQEDAVPTQSPELATAPANPSSLGANTEGSMRVAVIRGCNADSSHQQGIGHGLKFPVSPVWLVQGSDQFSTMWLKSELDKEIMNEPGSAFHMVQWQSVDGGTNTTSRVLTARKDIAILASSLNKRNGSLKDDGSGSSAQQAEEEIYIVMSHPDDRLYYPDQYKRWRFSFDSSTSNNKSSSLSLKVEAEEEKKEDDGNHCDRVWKPYFRLNAMEQQLVGYTHAPKTNLILWSRWPRAEVSVVDEN